MAEIKQRIKKILLKVRYRTAHIFGYPENFLSDSQIERIHTAAKEFLEQNNLKSKIRFDIIAISHLGKNIEIEHFEDAF